MKKVLAIILSAALLITALAVNVVAASATGTATGTFSGTFTANDYDSGMSTVTGSDVDIDGTWGGQFPDITRIIEKVAPLEDVTHIKVTVTANDITPCWGGTGTSPRVELHWNNRADTNAMTATFETTSGTAGQAVVYGDVPTGTTAVVLNPYAFNDQAESPIEFSVTVEVTYEEQGKVRIGDEYFDTLVEAVDAAQPGDTIYLLDNLEGDGISVASGSKFTVDFNGFTYTVVGNPAGSEGTKSQSFQLLKDSEIEFKNGTLTATTGSGVYMLIQNYCNLTLTDMDLIGTENVLYVMSNNHGNVLINGDTNITATDGNVAFDVCYANGSYEDGVSVTVDTTGTIKGDIELNVWDAAGSGTDPDINDYLEKANLTINNVKLEGEIINNVGGSGDYVPDPEVYSSPAGLELFISTMSDINAPSVATVTNENGDSTEIAGPGKYKVTYTPTTEITSYDWIMIKSAGSTGQSVAASSIPQGTTIRTTSLKINGSTISFPNDAESVDYTVGTNGQVELKYYFSLNWGGEIFTTKPSETISSIEIEFEIVENEKSEEEIKAEYNKKLQSAININGGIFAAGSNVNVYLPEGEYETDKDGNITVGNVQLPSVNKNNSDRITGCIYLNEKYHALIVNGRFIVYPHVDNGTGFCTACKGAINK